MTKKKTEKTEKINTQEDKPDEYDNRALIPVDVKYIGPNLEDVVVLDVWGRELDVVPMAMWSPRVTYAPEKSGWNYSYVIQREIAREEPYLFRDGEKTTRANIGLHTGEPIESKVSNRVLVPYQLFIIKGVKKGSKRHEF